MAVRPYWSGHIRLSLVSLPVNVYAALSRSRQIPLHEIYRPTGTRIHHQNVADDKPVSREDIVKGYEVEKGEYVLIEPSEIAAIKIPSKKVLDIVQFVDVHEIDEVYYETPYFVAPEGKDEDAFLVIRDALRATGKVGLGQLSISGRERLCAVKPYGSGLLLETLRYEDEIRAADPYFGDIKQAKADADQLSLAKELIKRKTAAFKPGKFHDHYREALQELINAKVEHRAPRQVVEDKPTGKVINLMDALRRSLNEKEAAKSSKAGKGAKSAAKKSSAKRSGKASAGGKRRAG